MFKTMKKIRSVKDVDFVCGEVDHVLTLFSGGLDSTYLLNILREQGVKVTALAIDLGDDLDTAELEATTKMLGASLRVIDAKGVFALEAVLPAIRAHARYLNNYPISSSLSRPLIARIAVEIANSNGCGAIFHTATQSQNSLRRLNGAIAQLGYCGFYGSPYEYTAITREEKAIALKEAGLHSFQQGAVSGDSNLWCREFESGVLDNPEYFTAPETLFKWTQFRKSNQLAETQHKLSITFLKGVPTAVNTVPMSPVELLAYLNSVVGAYGIGRFTGLEHLLDGEKVLEVREAPAAQILMDSFKHLETATHPYDLLREKMALEQRWVQEAVEGRWFCKLREAIDQFLAYTAKEVSGVVTYNLSRGTLDVESIVAQDPLYLRDRDAWEVSTAKKCSSRSLGECHPESSDRRVQSGLALGAK